MAVDQLCSSFNESRTDDFGYIHFCSVESDFVLDLQVHLTALHEVEERLPFICAHDTWATLSDGVGRWLLLLGWLLMVVVASTSTSAPRNPDVDSVIHQNDFPTRVINSVGM